MGVALTPWFSLENTMKPFPYKAILINKTTTQNASATGQTFKVEISRNGGVPPHQVEFRSYLDFAVLDQNGAQAPFGVRFKLETSVNGTDWMTVATVHELAAVGSFRGMRDIEQDMMGMVRVVVTPFSGNASLPTWRGSLHLIADGPFKASLDR